VKQIHHVCDIVQTNLVVDKIEAFSLLCFELWLACCWIYLKLIIKPLPHFRTHAKNILWACCQRPFQTEWITWGAHAFAQLSHVDMLGELVSKLVDSRMGWQFSLKNAWLLQIVGQLATQVGATWRSGQMARAWWTSSR
jgi:hypothetical protein